MAKIYRNENALRLNLRRISQFVTITWLSYFMMLYVITDALIGIGFFISSLLTLFSIRRFRITKAGVKGEDKALELVSELGGNYHVFSNLKIEYDNRKSETDLIIIGKKGIFVVEVKNHNGTIVGCVEEKQWTQHKVGKRGGRYKAELYNPTKQVGTHVWKLSKILKEQNVYTWVQGVVYFVNPKVKVKVKSGNVPVLTLDRRFVDYIENLKVKKELDDQTIRKAVSILKSKM